MIDWANTIGMTPAELIRSGMNDFCPSRMRPRPITLRGIWIGMRRAATVMATVTHTTTSMMAASTISRGQSTAPVRRYSAVLPIAGHPPCTIEKKISRLIPFPRPRSVICSPSHITNTPPTVSTKAVVIRKPQPGAATAPCTTPSMKIAMPQAWPAARPTVR